jgi:hypothetical protein
VVAVAVGPRLKQRQALEISSGLCLSSPGGTIGRPGAGVARASRAAIVIVTVFLQLCHRVVSVTVEETTLNKWLYEHQAYAFIFAGNGENRLESETYTVGVVVAAVVEVAGTSRYFLQKAVAAWLRSFRSFSGPLTLPQPQSIFGPFLPDCE